MATLQSRFVFNESVLDAEVDGESIMMHLDEGAYFTLNPIGTQIMAALKQGRTVGEVCADLTARFDAPAAQIEAETLALADKLVARGIASERP